MPLWVGQIVCVVTTIFPAQRGILALRHHCHTLKLRWIRAETTSAIEAAAREVGYSVLLTTVPPGGNNEALGTRLLSSGAEGILVVAAHEGMIPAVESVAGITPVVAVSAQPLGLPGVDVVGADQRLGARQVVEHLARTGVSSIAHTAGPQNWFDARARLAGFQEAVEDLALDGRVVGPGDWTPHAGAELCRRLIREGLPEAIFAANDMMAIGVMHTLHEHGLRVPEDVAVVGFDDTMGAEYLLPSLTTVAQPFSELGRIALTHLVHAVNGAEAPDEPSHTPPTRLVVRSSTGPERRSTNPSRSPTQHSSTTQSER